MLASIGEILFDVFPGYKVLGGAPFNFIYHINKLLNKGIFISRIGEDQPGNEIISFLSANNISPAFVQSDSIHPTGTAHVKILQNGNPEFTIDENCAYDFIQFSPGLKDYLEKNVQMLYFGTLAQRNQVSGRTIKSLWNSNVSFFYDANIRQHYFNQHIIEGSLRRANVVKVNNTELSLISELIFNSVSINRIEDPARKLMDKFEIDLMCITLGEGGAWLFNAEDSSFFKVEVDKIEDTVGAGDAYSAILAIGFLQGWDLERINRLASDFAAGICKVKGALPENSFYEKFKQILI